MLRYRGKITPINTMNITKELEQIDARIWNKPALKIAAINVIVALKAISDFADDTNKNINEITAAELLENILQMD